MAAAIVTTAAVAAAIVVVLAVMVAAGGAGIVIQISCQEGSNSIVSFDADTAVHHHAGICQGSAGAAANAAADQGIDTQLLQEACQSTVAAAVGLGNSFIDNIALGNLIDLKCRGVAKMLEHLACFISYCDLHNLFPFHGKAARKGQLSQY